MPRSEDGGPAGAKSVAYWDEYAPWYKLWLDHTDYHRGIKDVLAGLVHPGWRVLDIGGGSGVLTIPLLRSGCRVTVVEPSEVMRAYLTAETEARGVRADRIIASPWEDVAAGDAEGFDLVVASNSLHLTKIGTSASLRLILAGRPAHALVVSELEIPFGPDGGAEAAYDVAKAGSFQAESSFRYHGVEEALRHLDLKDRHGREHPSREDFVRSLVLEAGHFVHRRWATVRWLHLRRGRPGGAGL